MKNLDELIVELRKVYDDLNELKESNKEKKIDDIDFNKIKNKAKKIPLKNEILKNSKEYVQKSYLNLLASILHFNNLADVRESQMLYVARIIEGIDNKNITLENVYSSSMDMSIGELNEAITQVSKNIADLFIVDMMICANIKGRAKEEILEYISNIFSLMNVKFNVMKELMYLSSSILELNKNKILDINPIVNLNRFNYHLKNIIDRKISYSLNDIRKNDKGNIILLKAQIRHIEEPINFEEYSFDSIEFIGCKFENIHSIYCTNKKFKFMNCIFENIKESYNDEKDAWRREHPVDFINLDNVEMYSCKFINCNSSSYLLNLSEYILKDCEFLNCESNSNSENRDSYSQYYLFNMNKGIMDNIKFYCCYIHRRQDWSSNYVGLINISDSKVKNLDLYKCKSYIDTNYGRFARLYSCMVNGNNIAIENSNFRECEARTTYVSDGYYYNYILSLEKSLEKNNKFIDCYCKSQVSK